MEAGLVINKRYRLDQILAEGATGITWQARNLTTWRDVAIRLIELGDGPSSKMMDRLHKEIELLKQINHPLIPVIQELVAWSHEGRNWCAIIREHVDGDDLTAMVRNGGPFPESRVIQITIDVAEALQYLHAHSPPMIHSNIKPGSLILHPDGKPRLINFGSLRIKPDGEEEPVLHRGTQGYAPLEQLEGHARTASDIYALGATMLFLLTGKSPGAMKRIGFHIQWESEAPQLSPGMIRLLNKMLEPDWLRRLQSAQALRDQLFEMQNVNRPAVRREASVNRSQPRAPQQTDPQPATSWGERLGMLVLGFGFRKSAEKDLKPESVHVSTVESASSKDPDLTPRGLNDHRLHLAGAFGLVCLVFFVLSFQTRRQSQTSVWEDQNLSFSLYLDGNPIKATSLPKPRTWLYHKRVGMMDLGAAAIREDTLKLEDVPADVGYLRFFWDENTYNLPGFAGDLIAHSIESEGQLPQVLELTRILSLTAPVSTNGKIAGGGSLYCAGLHGFEGSAIFEWEPMEGATYNYSIERIGCGGRPNVMMEEGEIGEAYLKLDLPPSIAGARYALRIKAMRGGEVVGQLFIQDQAGQADYFPFAVRASADYARKESP